MITHFVPNSIFYIPLKRRLVRFILLNHLWNACLFWEGARNGTNFGVMAKRLNLDSHKKTTTKPEKSKAKKSQRVRSRRRQNKNPTTTVAVCDQQATVLCWFCRSGSFLFANTVTHTHTHTKRERERERKREASCECIIDPYSH